MESKQNYSNEKYLARKEKIKKYLEDNKERIANEKRIRYENKKEEIKEYQRNYNKMNREAINKSRRDKNASKPLFKLSVNIRNLIGNSFRNEGYSKTSKTSLILGCDFDTFITHIISQFEPWMNLENHGKYNGEECYGWDIDHIIPLSSGNSKEEIIRLNHYSNLRPLCSKVNRDIKRGKH